jgi:hypothetical protein
MASPAIRLVRVSSTGETLRIFDRCSANTVCTLANDKFDKADRWYHNGEHLRLGDDAARRSDPH